MRCIKCNTEHNNAYCPFCGTPANAEEPKKKQGVLFGFRSDKLWKKALSVGYLAFCSLMLFAALSGSREGQVTFFDFAIDKLFNFLLVVVFLSPYIFLSNTKLRNNMPLFKKRTAGSSFIGMVVVVFALLLLCGGVNSLHSQEYTADKENHDYTVVTTIEASCIAEGERTLHCEYCGHEEVEVVPVTSHKIVEQSRAEASCIASGKIISKCELCGEETSEEIPATGHTMTEISRVDASCTDAGSVLLKCDICGAEVTEEIPTLVHSMVEVSRKEATEDEDGEVVRRCEHCGTEAIEVLPCANPKGTVDNPYVMDAQSLFDISADGTSQARYLDQWVEVSGTVLAISDYSNLKGYHLVGEAGAGVVCWADSDAVEAEYGQSVVFLGKVSVADTKHIELSECQIKSVEWPEEKPVSPVTISNWSASIDYVGGVEWNFKLTNNTDKAIKYIVMEWYCYNAVGDMIYDEITGKSNHSVKFTGPLEAGQTTNTQRNTTLFYNHAYDSAKLTKLQVEFMDGTIINVTSQRYADIIID